MSEASTVTRGAHHIGLTVPDLEQTRRFFLDTLGYEQVGEVPDYPAVFLTDGSLMIALWQAADPDNATTVGEALICCSYPRTSSDDEEVVVDI